jgi:hypothetical protein
VCTFEDVPNKFVADYSFTDCPLASFRGLSSVDFAKICSLATTNALFASFEGCPGDLHTLKSVSFTGSPVTLYPLYRVMAILAFGECVKTIDGVPVTAAEFADVKKVDRDGRIAEFIRRGGIIRTFDANTIKDIEAQLEPPPPFDPPFPDRPSALEFSLFFDSRSLAAAEKVGMAHQPPNAALNRSLRIRACFSDFRVLFSTLDDATLLAPFVATFAEIAGRMGDPNVADISAAVAALPLPLEQVTAEAFSLLAGARAEYERAAAVLDAGALAAHCRPFIGTAKSFVEALSNILGGVRTFDAAQAAVKGLAEIEDGRAAPFAEILRGIEGRVADADVRRRIRVMRALPLAAHFRELREVLRTDGGEFADVVQTCADTEAAFEIVTDAYLRPPSADAIIVRLGRMRDQTVVQLLQGWNVLRRAFVGHLAKESAGEVERKKRFEAEVNRTNQVTRWVAATHSWIEERNVMEKQFTDIGRHCESFTKLMLEMKAKELAAEEVNERATIEKLDAEIRGLKTKLGLE